jgi:hypothetical protein
MQSAEEFVISEDKTVAETEPPGNVPDKVMERVWREERKAG